MSILFHLSTISAFGVGGNKTMFYPIIIMNGAIPDFQEPRRNRNLPSGAYTFPLDIIASNLSIAAINTLSASKAAS